jgi:hypothetical protein
VEEVAAVMRNKRCYCYGRRGCWYDKEERTCCCDEEEIMLLC